MPRTSMEVELLATRHRPDRDRETHQAILISMKEHTAATPLVVLTGWHPFRPQTQVLLPDDPNPDDAPAITVRDLPSCDNIELPGYSGSLPTAPPTYGTPSQPGNILCGLTPTQVDTPRPGPAPAP